MKAQPHPKVTMLLFVLLSEVAGLLAAAYFIITPLFEYFYDSKRLRQYPAPFLAGVTNLWHMQKQFTYQRWRSVDEAHKKLGPIVRLGPNELSFTDPRAIKDIYGHSSPALKADLYEAISSTHKHVLDVIDREEHARKRKLVANAMSMKMIEEYEHRVHEDILELVKQWDAHCTSLPAPGVTSHPEEETIDARRWLNLLTLDMIADLGMSTKIGFVKSGDDVVTCETVDGKTYKTHIEFGIGTNQNLTSTMGLSWNMRWLTTKLLAFHPGWKTGANMTNWSHHLTKQRLARERAGEKLHDIFDSLIWTKNRQPVPHELGEITAEVALILTAGSDTTGIAVCNILMLLIMNPRCLDKLHEELTTVCGDSEVVPAYDELKILPYLRACIDEALRQRPSLRQGLPRVTPPSGMEIAGHWIPGNTTVSAPCWTIHHDPNLFEDPQEYRPERWLGEAGAELQKWFFPFSTGARGCVGRNIAYMEVSLTIATIIRRYEFAFIEPNWQPTIYETLVAKQGPMPVKLWRRTNKVYC
ncbi:hypothetical protein LTR46_010916 [Exophiala xenobiotica]|nr:hypothetical protein LTR46_010916 [Exophiala xenobiotica]